MTAMRQKRVMAGIRKGAGQGSIENREIMDQLPCVEPETTNAATSHHEALFRDSRSRSEPSEGQPADLQKQNAALKIPFEKATASPFEEDDIPMKKATTKQLFTVIL
jgi:hypothetical protein